MTGLNRRNFLTVPCAAVVLAAAGACGDDGTSVSGSGSTSTTDTEGTTSLGSSSTTTATTVTDTGCPVGTPYCGCTPGGGCDPGYVCEFGTCVPGEDCPVGTEGCQCTPGGGCDPDLECMGGVCWPPDQICGNGFQEGSEECDDGDLDNNDECLTTCLLAECGDGYLWSGNEECDDGNFDNNDTCLNSCEVYTCGDGYIGPGEACDDGNSNNDDSCTNTCAFATCGDNIVQGGEECDDGNANDNDTCLSTCLTATCGDGFVWTGIEECDDANADNTDDCVSGCKIATCGDGFTWSGNEDCDDANADNTDACIDSCVAASCGDSYLWAGNEACDDGNNVGLDGCNADCVLPGTLLDEDFLDIDGGLDIAYGVTVDGNDQPIVAGRVSIGGVIHIWVRKYDSDLNELWTDTLNVSGGASAGRAVTTDANNNIYATGELHSNATARDLWLRKYTPAGAEIWSVTYNGPDNSHEYGRGVTLDGSGNVLVVGDGWVAGQAENGLLAKYDPDGNNIWLYTNVNAENQRDRLYGVVAEADDEFYVVGEIRWTVDKGNYFVRKYTPNGATIWWKNLNWANEGDVARSITLDPNGNNVSTGSIYHLTQLQNTYTIAYDAGGAAQWVNTFNGDDDLGDQGRGIATSPDNTLVVVGETGSVATAADVWIRKFDTSGTELWTTTWDREGLDERAYGVAVASDGTIYIVGEAAGAATDKDIFIQKRAP